MPFTEEYAGEEPTRAELDATQGAAVVEFGATWCGHCQAARPLVEELLGGERTVAHYKVEDARGKRLGRTFAVKLWPTLIFLLDGREVARVVRPRDPAALNDALAQIKSR